MRLIGVALAAVLIAGPAAAQSLCTETTPSPVYVTDPSLAVVATLTDYATVSEQAWASSELKVTPRGAGPDVPAVPNGTIVNPKSAWLPIDGVDCYQIGIVGQFLFGVPPDQEYDLWARLLTATNVPGPWSAGVPFTTVGPDPAPPPPPPDPAPSGCTWATVLYASGDVILVTTTQPRLATVQADLAAAGWSIDAITKESGNTRIVSARCV